MSVSMKYGTTFSRRLLQLMSPVRATTANTRQLAVDSATNRRPKYRDWVYFGAVATIVSSVFYKVGSTSRIVYDDAGLQGLHRVKTNPHVQYRGPFPW